MRTWHLTLGTTLFVVAMGLGGCGGGGGSDDAVDAGGSADASTTSAAPASTSTSAATGQASTATRPTDQPFSTCFDPTLRSTTDVSLLLPDEIAGFRRNEPNDQSEFDALPDNYARTYSRGGEKIEVLFGKTEPGSGVASVETARLEVAGAADGGDEPDVVATGRGRAWFLSKDQTFFGFSCDDGRFYGISAGGTAPRITLKAFMLSVHT